MASTAARIWGRGWGGSGQVPFLLAERAHTEGHRLMKGELLRRRVDAFKSKEMAGWHAPPLHRLPERPFRTLPGGILRKFFRRLSQFPLSFLAKSRRAPRSSGELRSRACHPVIKFSANKKKERRQACKRPVAFLFFLWQGNCCEALAGKRSDFIGETGTQRDCAEKESWN